MHGKYNEQRIALRYWLYGSGWHVAARAFDFAENLHKGVRKDGVTPEFAHQVWIASFVRTLRKTLPNPEIVLTVALLHDACEDYGVTREAVAKMFGEDVAEAVWVLTKIRDGVKIPDTVYYAEIAQNWIAAIVKGIDRAHNLGSMVDVFTREKQISYIAESNELVLPAIKKAKRRFPQVEEPLENIKQFVVTRIALIEAIHRATEAA